MPITGTYPNNHSIEKELKMNEPREIENRKRVDQGDPAWRGLYRISGVLLIVTALIWSIVFQAARILYTSGYPSDPASYLRLISQHQVLASFTWSFWIVADFMLMAPTIALYLILKPYNRTLAMLGGLFAMFFNIYDICVTELNSLTLVSLSHGYALAATETLKAPFIAAAAYGYHGLAIQTVISFATGTLGYLLWCIPMVKSPFRRGTAIFGAVMSILALIGSPAPLFPASLVLGLCQMIAVPACALWFILLGIQLYRYGKRLPSTKEYIQEPMKVEFSV
jgi:hypothetical protein